jgi:hypothetical protein
MKLNWIFILIICLGSFNLAAQVIPDRVYDHSLTTTRINATDYKYYLMDVGRSECRIYNLDHSLWKTISIKLPANYYLSDVKFVTQNLFNTDGNVELWYSAYNWVSTGTDTGYYRYESKVIDEQGKVLASVDNGSYAYIIQTGETRFSLLVYAYDNSFWPGSVKTHLFSIPSTPTTIYHVASLLEDPYPNPASQVIHLPLGAANSTGSLQVFSLTGQMVTQLQLNGQSVIQLNTAGWTPGTYTYRIQGVDGLSEAKKFSIR